MPPETLVVTTAHRADCTFGMGFYRLYLRDGGTVRYCLTQREVEQAAAFLGSLLERVERDGYCLDGDRQGDANTPDVVDAEWWLGLPVKDAMREVGLTNEREYAKVYKQVEAAVTRRGNRESQTGVHASIVIKRRGRPLVDVLADE